MKLFLTITLTLAALIGYFAPRLGIDKTATPPAKSHQIVLDDLDFYDRSPNMKNTYSKPFLDVVRRVNTEYFFRDNSTAGSGSRYGQIKLLASNAGSIFYLLPDVQVKGPTSLNLLLRTNSKIGEVFVNLYTSKIARHRITIDAASLSGEKWRRVELPVTEESKQDFDWDEFVKSGQLEAVSNLQGIEFDAKHMIALEVGITGASEGDTIDFDRITFDRTEEPSKVIAVKLEPNDYERAEIFYRFGDGKTSVAIPPETGEFGIEIPPNSEQIEIYALIDNIFQVPTVGRYIEIGSFVPPVVIRTKNNKIKSKDMAKIRGGMSIESSELLSEIYSPNRYMFHKKAKYREYAVENYVNKFGYSDKDRTYENPDHSYRVVFVGSCSEAGIQVDEQSGISAQTEAILRFQKSKFQRPIEVIGVSHQYMVLSQWYPSFINHMLKFKPDLIIFNFSAPDQLRHILLSENSDYYGFDPKHPRNYSFDLSKSGELIHIPHDPLWRNYTGKGRKKSDFDWNVEAFLVDTNKYPKIIHQSIDLISKSLKIFKSIANQNGAKFVLSYAGRYDVSINFERVDGEKKYSTKLIGPLVQKIADNAGVPFVNFAPDLKRYMKQQNGKNTLFYAKDGHWSPHGHRAVSEALAHYIGKSIDVAKAP